MERRQFIQNMAVAGTTFMLGSHSAIAGIYKGSPAKKVVLGVMGVNSRGAFLAQKFAGLNDVEIGYICDVDSNAMNKCIAEIEKITGKRPKGITDVRQLLEKKDLDALVIAAPDHWHAPATILACQAGKHVYVEKPCSHNPHEGELAIQAAAKYNRLVQMGSQRRSFSNVQKMVQELHSGIIGRAYFARGWYVNNRKSIGIGKAAPIPANLNYDLWQGYAPRRPYKDNLIHYNWHWFWHWGTGEALNNGTHEIDVMRWGLGADFPNRVTSGGGRFAFKDDWETPDTQTIVVNFPNDTSLSWEGRSCNPFNSEGVGRGVVFYGDHGTINYGGGNGYQVFDMENKLVKEVKDETPVDASNKVSPTEMLDRVHLQNFVNAIRGDEQLNQTIINGHRSTLVPQLGNIAQRVGRVLNIDPKNGHILHDAEAAKLWSREYQPGWDLKV
ncbi:MULTISPECIES: Gfo/Idh/MocA family protein [unclassified Mucilaginibacter]|uniref:Gfo/Idh/MocA family protein n=1 Tax=unclassified Mucilaginibacter TaxID=2617802 RepID=UPI00095C634E|nr:MULTISPECIES: Gfo/Idh/MocA family oxidoreductase [unclassified Mucilaginibacter]OJW12829.1 MAG: dehydrogenase [Mucilaginibacter sp. 44-25]PLW89409.1 MAG: dehydrogenase [Mucilaginibacter sp.]HEK20751.1 Gfo/Idh/MocA family oxidoreductase [Bacteroidota bacterium]